MMARVILLFLTPLLLHHRLMAFLDSGHPKKTPGTEAAEGEPAVPAELARMMSPQSTQPSPLHRGSGFQRSGSRSPSYYRRRRRDNNSVNLKDIVDEARARTPDSDVQVGHAPGAVEDTAQRLAERNQLLEDEGRLFAQRRKLLRLRAALNADSSTVAASASPARSAPARAPRSPNSAPRGSQSVGASPVLPAAESARRQAAPVRSTSSWRDEAGATSRPLDATPVRHSPLARSQGVHGVPTPSSGRSRSFVAQPQGHSPPHSSLRTETRPAAAPATGSAGAAPADSDSDNLSDFESEFV